MEALRLLRSGEISLLDVRSEGEFSKGSFPSTKNIPILNDKHRHEVGLTYRQKGSEAAIALGHELVDPLRPGLVSKWGEYCFNSKSVGVYCWRGGLRSKIASQWMAEAGLRVKRVETGFKGMRNAILALFEKPYPLIVLGGMTGSGKTGMLREFSNSVDLERAANHRGSAFGLSLGETQPTQLSFENSLGMELLGPGGIRIVEDESASIGNCRIPSAFYRQMRRAPFVQVEVSRRVRAENIFNDYIYSYFENSGDPEKLKDYFSLCLWNISDRLGGLRYQKLVALMERGFSQGIEDRDAHIPWIAALLEEYYDPQYQYSMKKKARPVWFRGSPAECREWLGSLS